MSHAFNGLLVRQIEITNGMLVFTYTYLIDGLRELVQWALIIAVWHSWLNAVKWLRGGCRLHDYETERIAIVVITWVIASILQEHYAVAENKYVVAGVILGMYSGAIERLVRWNDLKQRWEAAE